MAHKKVITSNPEVKRVNKLAEMRIGYIHDDASEIHSKLDKLMAAVDDFKENHGDFGEKIPRIYNMLDTALGELDDAFAEIELVRDAVT